MSLENKLPEQLAREGMSDLKNRKREEKQNQARTNHLKHNDDLRASGQGQYADTPDTEAGHKKRIETSEKIIEGIDAKNEKIQEFIKSDKGGVIMGEALAELQERLRKEIKEAHASGDDEKAKSLSHEEYATNEAYRRAEVDYGQDRHNPSPAKTIERVKEAIRNLFR